MAKLPLRGSSDPVTSFGLPYGSSASATSVSDARVRWSLFAVWLALLIPGLIFVARYARTNPYVDEWAFVPVLFEEKPTGPWLWELHNEHRFPLPRLIYIGLFRLTGDLRTGCYVSLLGISLLAAGLMRLARQIRGRSSLADAVFPLLLMHAGQDENLYMGYQLAFALTAALAAGLLAVILRSGPGSNFRKALLGTLLGWLLLTCGAAGLAYGVAAAAWVGILGVFGGMRAYQRIVLLSSTMLTPAYIAVYMLGYVRPGHHPKSAGFYESARIGLEAQAMAFGPGAHGLWYVGLGIVILLVAIWTVAQLVRWLVRSNMDPRAAGLFLYVGAAGAVAFGIGWGRSGFHDDMGFAWRYGWLTMPAIWAAYFTWLLRSGRVSTYCPALLAVFAAILLPISEASGFRLGERQLRPSEERWEADVRAGLTAEQVFERNYPGLGDPFRSEVIDAMRLMRDHRYTYYEFLGADTP
jgi:hypothetical protein